MTPSRGVFAAFDRMETNMMSAACKSSAATATDYPMRALPALPPLRRNATCAPERFVGAQEPTLAELLDDPILARLLASDGIVMDELLVVVAKARRALERR